MISERLGHESPTFTLKQYAHVTPGMQAGAAARRCDLLPAVGSILSVFPIAVMVPVAHASRAQVVIVNGEPTEFDDLAHVVVRGSICEALPRLVR